MKSNTIKTVILVCSTCLGLILSIGCKTSRPPVVVNPRKSIHFCCEFKHGDQPPAFCICIADSVPNPKGQFVKKLNYKWFDRFGNRYCNLYIKDPCAKSGVNRRSIVPGVNFASPDRISAGGLFNLYFSDIQNDLNTGFDDPTKAVFVDVVTQVFSDIDAMLVTPGNSCSNPFVPVNFEVQSINSPNSGILGEASAYHEYLGETSGIKHNEVWKAINGGVNDPALWDGYIKINLGYSNWFTGYNGNTSGLDLYSVVLHEVLHAMGFASLIAENGSSKFQLTSGMPILHNYSAFDQFLKFENGSGNIYNTGVITNTGGYNWSYNINSIPANDLRSGCQNPTPSGPDIRFLGTNNIPGSFAYAPANWSNGSSLSHFLIDCDNVNTSEFVMNPSIAAGDSRRITQEEANTLCDLGYKLTGTYGTPVLDAGGVNQNVQTVPVCGQLLVAVDDKGPCCTNNNFTVQFCQNNTLTIPTSDLICNDVFTGSVSVVDFEVLTTGVGIPSSNTDFIFTPTQLGTEILRYRLQDNSGNKSNYAYVFVDVWHCPGFNCTNTSLCNLICNPNLADFNNDCQPSGCSFSGMPPSCLEGWSPMFGSPDYAISPACPSANGPYYNFAQLPGNAGGKVALHGAGPSQSYGGIENEALMAKVGLVSGKKYIFSIHVQEYSNNINGGIGLDIGSLFSNTITWNTTFNQNVPLPANAQLIGQLPFGIISDNWQQFIMCFVSNDNYDRFFIQAFGNNTQRAFIDQIELIEDNIESINKNYTAFCGQSLVIGQQLCDITNMNYSWWDITDPNPANHIQLTDGTSVLVTGISIPAGNTNGSQIQVSPDQTKVYELRRTIISPIGTNGIPIAMNNCDKNVQVTVNVNTNIAIQKNVLSGTTAAPGSTVQFQIVTTNSTGNALSNVVLQDILHPDLLIGTLSVASNANISHSLSSNTINFTVINLPDGGTETINYSLQLSPATTQTSITNCATVEYAGCFQEECVDITISSCACPGWPQFIPTLDATGSKIRVASNGDVYSTSGGGNFTFSNCSNNFSVNGNGILAKYNSCGKLIWIESLPKAGMEISISEVSGNTFVYITGLNFVAKFADNGTSASQLWWYDMNSSTTAIAALATDNQGNAYVAGNFQINTAIQHNGATLNINVPNGAGIFLLKYDPNGTIIWNEVIKNTVVTVSPCNYTTIKIKGMAVNSNGDKIFIIGDGINATLDFGLGSNCSLIIPPLNAPTCVRTDIFTAIFEQNLNAYNCNWVERISGDGSNFGFDIACENVNNNFYFTGWATDNSASLSGFSMPPTGNSQTRGHFLSKYTYNSGAGNFNSIYRDGNLQTNYVTGHINDIFFDNVSGNTLFLTKRTGNGEPIILKHAGSSIISSLWSAPTPAVPLTNGHANSVATNGLVNANNNREVFFTGWCSTGVVFDVSSNSGTIQVTYPQGGIFIAKLEDQSSVGVLKQ